MACYNDCSRSIHPLFPEETVKSIVVILAVLVAAMALPALSRADDNRQALMNVCLSEGESEACCACGVDKITEMMTEDELSAMVELFNLMKEFEAASGDEARMNELMARAEQVQSRIDEQKMTTMDQQITEACGSVCPQQSQ